MEKQVKSFLEFIRNDKKLSENTLQSYKRDVMQYYKYVDVKKTNYTKATKKDIEEYLDYLKENGKKTSTISRNLASVRAFYQFLLRTKKVKVNPTEGIQSPKVEKKAPSILSSQEIELLLQQPKNVDLKGTRDKAMLEFAYATGMKVTEMISLDIDSANLEEAYVVCKSGGRERKIPLGKLALKALKEYI